MGTISMNITDKGKQLKIFIVSKSELCELFGVHPVTLERWFFDDEILNKLNLTREQYKKRKRFYLNEVDIIKAHFNI